MLIQCEYQTGDFLLKGGNIYYKDVLICSKGLSPIVTSGTDELYLLSARSPLSCQWLVIVQSRFPVFYECKRVEFGAGRVVLYLMNDSILGVKSFKNGVMDRLLVDPIYKI